MTKNTNIYIYFALLFNTDMHEGSNSHSLLFRIEKLKVPAIERRNQTHVGRAEIDEKERKCRRVLDKADGTQWK